MSINTITIFNFSNENDLSNWRVVDDVVMGGISSGKLSIDQKGNGIFKGEISLENNGGFSSIRYNSTKVKIDNQKKFVIRLKGDGKKYQFRVKSDSEDYYSYAFTFSTNGKWETIEIPFHKMKPVFRGRNLDIENYNGNQLEEISILIGNKKPEKFILEIDKIEIN